MNIEERIVSNFLGQRSAEDPGSLYIKKGVMAAQTNSFLLNKGRNGLDGQTGIGTNLATNSTTGLNGYGLRQYEWICGDGNTYQLFYRRNGTTCTIVYFKNGARTGAPTAMTYLSIAGAAITENSDFYVPQQTLPSWGVYGGCLYLAMGQPGIFRITAKNGALTAQLTTAPASSKMLIVDNRMWVAVGDEPIIRWSALGDVERFTPKLAEIEADTYGIDYRVTLQSEGVAGNIVDCKMFGKSKVWWTQNECFVIYGSGDSKDTVFDKIGSGMGMNGQAIVYDNACYWPSKYKGGSWLALTFGSSVVDGQQIDVQDEKNIGFRTFDVGKKIADVLQAMPQTTIANAVVSWDTNPDWDCVAAKEGLSTSTEPGYIAMNPTGNLIACTPQVTLGTGWTASGDAGNLIDSKPLYPSIDTPTATTVVYTNDSGVLADMVYVHIYNPGGLYKTYSSTIYNRSSTWMEYDVLTETSIIQIDFQCSNKILRFTLNPNGYVGFLRFFLLVNVATRAITMGEIRLEGSAASTATVYTEACTATSKAVLTGLTASVNTNFGRFYASYVGTSSDGTGGITFYVRAGNTAFASLATNTSYTKTSDTRLTDATKTFVTAGVKVGDYVTITGVNYPVVAVAETYIDIVGTLPSSTTYTIYGGAPATWSTWTAVTGNDLLTGYDLKQLNFITGGADVVASSTGLLYVQAYATHSKGANIGNGLIPKLDAMFFTAQTGSNLTFAPSGFYDDKIFTCILTNSSSTAPDCEIVRYLDGEHSVITGKKVNSYLNTSDGECLVTEGYALGKQYAGNRNYTTTDNSTETKLVRIWKGQEDSGLLYGGKLRVELNGFNGAGSADDPGVDAISVGA
jgi:hypothetical protein